MARGVYPRAVCSAGRPRCPVPNMVGMDVAPSDPGAVACAATPPSSSTRRDLVIRFQAGAHHQQIAARRMWLSTPQGPTAINFDLAPPLSSSGADANPPRHQQTKKPAMSSHGRSHHSLSATQGARIRVSASSRPYQTVCAAFQGGHVRHRRTTRGRVQKNRPSFVMAGRTTCSASPKVPESGSTYQRIHIQFRAPRAHLHSQGPPTCADSSIEAGPGHKKTDHIIHMAGRTTCSSPPKVPG